MYSLYEKFSNYLDINVNNFLITHGSEQGIRYVFDSYLDYGDEVVYLNPSYAMYDVYAHYNKAKVKTINFNEKICQ